LDCMADGHALRALNPFVNREGVSCMADGHAQRYSAQPVHEQGRRVSCMADGRAQSRALSPFVNREEGSVAWLLAMLRERSTRS
jgi:hypothetical protein